MFPPPRPWAQIATVDLDREYTAFTSRFFLRSYRRVPAFLRAANRIGKEANSAPGVIGWSLAADLRKLEFHTLSAWEDAASLRAFVELPRHAEAMRAFTNDLRRETLFAHFSVAGRDLPLRWEDAVARQERRA